MQKTFLQTGKKAGSRPHLEGRVRKIVKDQLEEGKADAAPETLTAKRTFYMPYKLVVRETAGITKVKMFFDDGAEPHPLGNSSKECIYTYPPRQPLYKGHSYRLVSERKMEMPFCSCSTLTVEKNTPEIH